MKQHGLRARKRLGQHFLTDGQVFSKIIEAAELSGSDVVVEVGAGNGSLTRRLADKAGAVLAVELDDRLVDILKKEFGHSDKVRIIAGDILNIDPENLINQYYGKICPDENKVKYKVVANLPYYITSPVLRHFFETTLKPELMVVMVQREVGETICAQPGKMSLLSVAVQFYGKPSIVTAVPSACFYPRPAVDSVVVRIQVYPGNALNIADEAGFFYAVRSGFSSPRKQLVNSLATGLKIETWKAREILQASGLEFTRRAQTLTLNDWASLAGTIKRIGFSGNQDEGLCQGEPHLRGTR